MLAVILAGGESRRMGKDKARLELSGEQMLQRLVKAYGEFFRVAVSVRKKGQQNTFGALEVVDEFPGKGPLGGLYSAFSQTKAQKVFLTATDLPFGDPVLALHMSRLVGEDYDACIIKRRNGRIEPLFSVYSGECLPKIKQCIENDQLSMRSLLAKVRVLELEEDKLPTWEMEKVLFNMNTPKEYSLAKEMCSGADIPVISFVGWSGSGKTTFLEKLLPVLTERNIRVGLVKHDAHKIQMDKPGKDTYRLYNAGADTVAISNSEQLAVIKHCEGQPALKEILSYFKNVDVIITEGYKTGENRKIEIHRRATGKRPACLDDEKLLAVITDEVLDTGVPQLGLDDLERVADIISDITSKL